MKIIIRKDTKKMRISEQKNDFSDNFSKNLVNIKNVCIFVALKKH
jgi:hypothetical protein